VNDLLRYEEDYKNGEKVEDVRRLYLECYEGVYLKKEVKNENEVIDLDEDVDLNENQNQSKTNLQMKNTNAIAISKEVENIFRKFSNSNSNNTTSARDGENQAESDSDLNTLLPTLIKYETTLSEKLTKEHLSFESEKGNALGSLNEIS